MLTSIQNFSQRVAHAVISRGAQATCALLVTASKANAYVQSDEVWQIGQGALLAASGIAMTAKALSCRKSAWRTTALASGSAMMGCGAYIIGTNFAKMCGWSDSTPHQPQLRDAPLSLFPQGALLTASGIAMTAKARSCKKSGWRTAGLVTGAGMMGCGAVIMGTSVAKMCDWSDFTPPQSQPRDAPHPFFPQCSKDRRKNQMVFCHVADGKGDVMGCAKIYNAKKRSFPEHSVEIALERELKSYLPRYFEPSFCSQITYLNTYAEIANRKDLDLVIDYPIFCNADQVSVVNATILSGTTAHLALFEYDYVDGAAAFREVLRATKSTSYSLGQQAESIGQLLDTTLYEASKLSRNFTSLQRLEHLADLPSGLQQAILGEEYSPQALVRFDTKWLHYTAYTKHPYGKDAFVQTVSAYSRFLNTTQQPCFTLIGRPLSPFFYPLNIPLAQREIFRKLEGSGFSQVEIYQSSLENSDLFQRQVVSLSPNIGMHMKIVSVPFLQHKHFLKLLQAGQKITGNTGDQSASEASSYGLYSLYELLSSKRPFASSLVEVARKMDPELGKIVAGLFLNLDEKAMEIDIENLLEYGVVEKVWPDHLIANAVKALRRLSKKPKLWERFIDHLFTHHNAFDKIHQLVQRYVND